MFITLEGIEGSGKSTLQRGLAAHFESRGRTVLCTREPGGSGLGKSLRAMLLKPDAQICPQAELYLFLADRAQHVQEVIKPALARGEVVICDRFVHSTIAYQGAGRGLDVQQLLSLNRMALDGLWPERVLLLDLPVGVGLERVRARLLAEECGVDEGRFDAESAAFHEKIRASYLAQARAEPTVFSLLDGQASAAHVLRASLMCFENI